MIISAIITQCFKSYKAILLFLLIIFIAGISAFWTIPKEAEPDIAIPIINISMRHEGISPEDSERLLLRPVEKQLQGIQGLKEMRSIAGENIGIITLEFFAGFDNKRALADTREKVDQAKSDLPDDTDEPIVAEVNFALFPILNVILSGPLEEREMINLAKHLRDDIESIPGVLEVELGGDREELVEILVDPEMIQNYHLSLEEIFNFVNSNNRLIAAGSIENEKGKMVVKVPGLVRDLPDLLSMPVKVDQDIVVTLQDIAKVQRTYKTPATIARLDGQHAISLSVKKRIGANIIETITQVKELVDSNRRYWPEQLKISYSQDKSKNIRNMLRDLQNSAITAIILVILVIVYYLGPRPSLLVSISIPGSLLSSILILKMLGFTLNIVVLFSLILVTGMLVDGAIIVAEFAQRLIHEQNKRPMEAFKDASVRMFWPIVASITTTIVVFIPFLFWPGIVGEFMKYLPVTVIITLIASLFMALIFIPIIGGLITPHMARAPVKKSKKTVESHGITFDASYLELPPEQSPLLKWYLKKLAVEIDRPGRNILLILGIIILIYVAYIFFGRGVEFFPSIEPDYAQVQIKSRGDTSVWEKDEISKEVESHIYEMEEINFVYSKTYANSSTGQEQLSNDTTSVIFLDFVDWDERRKAFEILDEIKTKTTQIGGIVLEFTQERRGPSADKPIQIEVQSDNSELLAEKTHEILDLLKQIKGIKDIESSLPLPGIEWQIQVDRPKAALYDANIALLGSFVTLATDGLLLSKYRPDDSDDEIDIRARFPYHERNLKTLQEMQVETPKGSIPISQFISLKPQPKISSIKRTDAQRVHLIKADAETGYLASDLINQAKTEIKKWQESQNTGQLNLSQQVAVVFKGEDKDQKEAATFLQNAFLISLLLMLIILVIEFNSFYQSFLVLSAVFLSTAGVLLGLLLTNQPFSIVMSGIGIIALGGVIVHNNIILIDTYNELKGLGLETKKAILVTCSKRMRPVLLTAGTSVLALMPLVFAIDLDFVNQEVNIGSPSTQWWRQLSSAIAGGLTFATILTLLITPCLIIYGENVGPKINEIRNKLISTVMDKVNKTP